MYFPYFVAYICIGLIISMVVFAWAVRSGQFRDQQRARFIPLRGVSDEGPVKATRFQKWEIYGLFILAVGGLSLSGAVLLFALYFSKV